MVERTEEENKRDAEMQQMMMESEDAWRASFDPKHPEFHGGSLQAVPTSEQKIVPASMPTEFTEEQPEVSPFPESFQTD
jgi:hypothetical protein